MRSEERAIVLLRVVNIGSTKAAIYDGRLEINQYTSFWGDDSLVIGSIVIPPYELSPGEVFVHHLDLQHVGEMVFRKMDESHPLKVTMQWVRCEGEIRYMDGNETTRTTGWNRLYDASSSRFEKTENESEYED